ncbi:hypothetical protein V1264_002767 [Littorina saxatilis]|uniref:Uncharacterized protein n=1 Tax=Littorina saxatilis TaxID=31220 RepID=A0AAN9G7U4_9CAEN
MVENAEQAQRELTRDKRFSGAGLKPPGSLDFHTAKDNLESQWKKWKRQWVNYSIASRLSEEKSEFQTAVFLTVAGEDAAELVETWKFDDPTHRHNIEKVLEKFEQFCVVQTNETYETYKFNQRAQKEDESVNTYVTVLRTLAKNCRFGQMEDRLIRDRLVAGICSDEIRRKLLEEKDLDLQKAIDIVRLYDITSTRAKDMSSTGEEVHKVCDFSGRKGVTTRKAPKAGATQVDCKFCGRKHAQVKEQCPAYKKTCRRCGGPNHFATVCLKTEKKQMNTCQCHDCDDVLCDDDDDNVDLDVLHVGGSENAVHAKMMINKVEVSFQLDSGASTNCMSTSTYTKVTGDKTLKSLDRSNKKLRMYDEREVRPLGEKIMKVTNPKNKQVYKVRFQVVQGESKPILGFRAVQAMELIKVVTENIAVVDQSVLGQFDDVFEGELGDLQGVLHIQTDSTVSPVKLPCRKWPLAIRDKVKKELDRLQALGVITPVHSPTDWVSSVVVTMKPNGSVRLCLDPKPLNKALKRNDYPMKTIDDVLGELQGARYFSHFDARNGFWHVHLDEESSLLTTFETPEGKFRWLRMPFGISVAPEEFQRRMDEAVQGLPGVFAVHDDIIVWGKGDTDEEASVDHDRNVQSLLQRCREKNVKLNKQKVELKKTEISYLGHVISKEGLKVDPKKVDAINSFRQPEDKADVQRLLGMVGYLQKFAPQLSEKAAPLRELVKKNVLFRWNEDHTKALDEIKAMLSEPPVLRYFSSEGKTTLQCDASEFGLGACLMTDGQPVHFASRALTETERHYAQIEKEMLAIVFGLERFERYCFGRQVEVESDHKPLIPIHQKSLLSAPKRLQRMLMRTQRFDYTVVYKKGSEMWLADALSRAVHKSSGGKGKVEKEAIFQTDLEKEVEDIQMASYISVCESTLQELQKMTTEDENLCHLKRVIQGGWPEDKRSVPLRLQVYFPFREELSVQNGLVFKAERIVVPEGMKQRIMQLLHKSHTGLQGCLRRAREVVYWVNMAKDMERFLSQCEPCQTFQKAQPKEPSISHPIPERPWQYVATDLMECRGNDYLVVVDYYSDFFEVDRLDKKTGKEVIYKLKAHFARHGIPERLVSDNGPPFQGSEFRTFANQWGFEHVTSSPGYPQSNGKAENTVKTVKDLMKKCAEDQSDAYLALLELRNIPSEKMQTSPSQRLFGRRTRTLLPTAKTLLKPKTCTGVKQKLEQKKFTQQQYYNRSSTELSDLKPGQEVRFKAPRTNRWIKATVDSQVDVRSYKIRTADGKEYRRNRKDLRQASHKFTVHVQPRCVHTDAEYSTMDRDQMDRQSQSLCNRHRQYREQEKQTGKTHEFNIPEENTDTQVPTHDINTRVDTRNTETHVQSPKKSTCIKLNIQNKAATCTKTQTPQTDCAATQTCTSRGRVIKKPSYLQEYTT